MNSVKVESDRMLPLNRRNEVISLLVVYYFKMMKRGDYFLLFRLVDYIRKTTCWSNRDRARHDEIMKEIKRVAKIEPHCLNSHRHIRKWSFRYHGLLSEGELIKFDIEMKEGISA